MQNNKNLETFRKPIRLSTGKYREPGLYFLTSCSYENAPLFGSVQEGKLTLNSVGEIIYRWWEKLPGKFSRIELRDFIIMPNHFHGIIIIEREEACDAKREEPWMDSKREEPRMDLKREEPWMDLKREEPWLLPYDGTNGKSVGEDPRVLPSRVLPNIPRIMQWFKTMSTNEFLRFQKQSCESDSPRLWQRSYYDHIIRNDADYRRISDYIKNNPGKWMADRFHP